MNSERTKKILEILTSKNAADVTELAESLGVSQVTTRKDLDYLESRGLIKREHGYAKLCSPDDINGRIAYHYEEKKKIAKKAAELVNEGDTVMIESGSCCALLALELSEKLKDLTIVTNSAFIAEYIRGKSDFHIVLLGGIYQKDSQVMVGPMLARCAENFLVNYLFIGTDGYSQRTGFTNRDHMRAQAVRDMARQAEQVIILTESEKFGKRGTVPLNLKDSNISVITDENIPEDAAAILREENIKLIYV